MGLALLELITKCGKAIAITGGKLEEAGLLVSGADHRSTLHSVALPDCHVGPPSSQRHCKEAVDGPVPADSAGSFMRSSPVLTAPSGIPLRERVENSHACGREVVDVPRDNDKIVNQCRRRNLLVQRVLGIRHTKPTPDMGDLLIQG